MKAITANRLEDGRVVYRNVAGQWTEALSTAAEFEDGAAADAALIDAEKDEHVIVGPYLMDVEENTPSGRKTIRETIRLAGPSAGSLHTKSAGV